MEADPTAAPPPLCRRVSPELLLLCLALFVTLGYLAFMLSATRGRFVAQISDLYVVCQYARAMAEGHAFHYNADEPASTGATSLLHTAVLALAYRVGLHGERLIAFAIGWGAALYVFSVWIAQRIGRRLFGDREGWLAGLTVALGGSTVWAFLYGSDTAPMMAFTLLFFERLIAEWDTHQPRGTLVALALLVATRPEGLALAILAGGCLTPRRARRRTYRGTWIFWIPTMLGGALLLMSRYVTGNWLGSSIADKSLWSTYGFREALAIVSEYFMDVLRGLLFGFYPSQVPIGLARGWAPYALPPLALLFVVATVLLVAKPFRAVVCTLLGLITATWCLFAANLFIGFHFNRYLMWAFPALQVMAAVGVGLTAQHFGAGNAARERRLFRAGAILFLTWGALATVRFACMYGEMAGVMARRDVATADWLAQHLPPGARVANVATSIEFLTGHHNMNLHGVMSPAFFGNRSAEREAGVLESLVRLPVAARPEYLLTTSSLQRDSVLMRGLAGELLYRSTSFDDELELYRFDATLLNRSGRWLLAETADAVAGLGEVDRLNVGDAQDEQIHAYRVESQSGDLRLNATVRIAAYGGETARPLIADAGRAVFGSERFLVRARPGRDLLVVMRTAPDVEANVFRASGPARVALEFPQAAASLRARGTTIGDIVRRPRSGWDEWIWRIPADRVTNAPCVLTVSGRYASFRYWFFQ